MLKRHQRLFREEDFNRVYRRGWHMSNAWMILRFCPGKRNQRRFGVVIPNAVIRRAVDRNHIRRQLRALIAMQHPSFPAGFDWILQIKATPPRMMAELRLQFAVLFQKILTRSHITGGYAQ